MAAMIEFRLRSKQINDTSPADFIWSVVEVDPPDPDTNYIGVRTIVGGGSNSIQEAGREGLNSYEAIIRTPVGPIRHEEECACGALLVVEVRRSKKSPYYWDSIRELTCGCGRNFGVKLSFRGNPCEPRISLLYRTSVG